MSMTDDGVVDDPARLHPLIAEAVGQVASLQAQLDYWRNNTIGTPMWGTEETKQRIEHLQETLAHRRGMRDRLMAKLVTD
jgi:hypothetical protein